MATNPTLLGDWYKDYLAKPPKAETYTAASAGTTNWNVADNQTVQGQLKGILKSGGPLMEQAATAGAQTANRRGLLNSSMGVQAGQAALYDKALPIASQDANTYGQSAQFNANAANTASIANAGFTNDAGRFNAGAKNDMSGMLFRTAADFGLEDKRQTFQAGETAADRAWRTGERVGSEGFAAGQSALDRDFRTGERVGAQTFQSGENVLDRTFQSGEKALDRTFQSGERALDRDFSTTERQAIQKFETDRLQVQNDFAARQQQLQEQGMDKRQAQQLAMQEAMTRLGESGVQNRFDAQQALQSDQFSFEQAAMDRRLVQQHEQRLKEMGFAAELDLDSVPSNFAASVSSNTMNAVNAIAGDPNLDAAAKQNAIQNVIENGNATLRWAAITYKTAFPPIPGWGEPAAPNTDPAAAPPAAPPAPSEQPVPNPNIP